MARNRPQPEADREEVLECVQQNCPHCNKLMWNKYDNYRTVRTLSGSVAKSFEGQKDLMQSLDLGNHSEGLCCKKFEKHCM